MNNIGEKIIGEPVSLKWLILPNKVQGLPIFNFDLIITSISMFSEGETNWEKTYEIEEQGTGILTDD